MGILLVACDYLEIFGYSVRVLFRQLNVVRRHVEAEPAFDGLI